MSFVNKIYKLDKWLFNKGRSALQRDFTIRYLSNINPNYYLVNKFIKISSLCYKRQLTGIHFTRQIQTKTHTYHARELIWARTKVLGTSESYSNSIATSLPEKENLQVSDVQNILDKQWISMNIQEMLENFEFLSYYAKENTESVADPKYQGILEVMASKIPECSDKDLQFILKCLELWQIDSNNLTFKLLYEAIDKECIKRTSNWSINEILLMNDLFFAIRLNRILDFTWKSLSKIGWKPQNMTPANLVQFVFFMKSNRKLPCNLYPIEYYFEQNFDHFTIDELGIFAMAFHKYNTSIKSVDFLMLIMQKLTNEINTVDDFTLLALLKIFRCIKYSLYCESIDKLIDAIEPQIDKKPIHVLVYIAEWLKTVRFQKEIYSKMLNRFEKEVSNMNLSLIEKVLYSLYSFNYTPEQTSFFTLAFDEILKPERAKYIEKSPNSFVKCNLSALNAEFYPEAALKKVMDPEYIKKYTSDKPKWLQDYLSMDYQIEIAHPEYDGPRLDQETKIWLLKRFGSLNNYTKKQNKKLVTRWNTLQNIISSCKKICGSETAVHEDILLPHMALPDVVLCYDPQTKKYLSPKEQLSQISESEVKYAPKDGKDWYCLIIATDLVLMNNDRRKYTGYLSKRIKNLELIGYKPIVIIMADFANKEESERDEFIRKLLPS